MSTAKTMIEIQHVSKMFRIHHESEQYMSIREKLSGLFTRKSSIDEDFWAVKDVSFNVMPGESKAIIGRNGSGKSTLLKILSRITPPTTGRILSRGRMASLLEVGTGFHPELTGSENIFFNGSLLGMKRKEIESRFDQIVDFSGVERFLDTPLKRYSSGMQLRLAFAVASFLESEILVIDEVLAVGDIDFQKKCLDRMESVTKSGRTVLFVSHNMAAIRALCSSVVVLDKGQIKFHGNVSDGIDQYMLIASTWENEPGIFDLKDHPSVKLHGGITTVKLLKNGKPSYLFFSGDKFEVEFEYSGLTPMAEMNFKFILKDSFFQSLINITDQDLGVKLIAGKNGYGKMSLIIDSLPVYGNSTYYIDLYLGDGNRSSLLIENAISFKLEPKDVFKTGKFIDPRLNSVFPGKMELLQ